MEGSGSLPQISGGAAWSLASAMFALGDALVSAGAATGSGTSADRRPERDCRPASSR